jgi:Na+/phosphate symporter
MHSRITELIRELVQTVHDNPALQKIIDEDPKAEMNPLIHSHLQNTAFLVGYDFLKLNLRTARMLEEKKYDLIKIRRRMEEYLRKHAHEQDIIKLALFYGVSLK